MEREKLFIINDTALYCDFYLLDRYYPEVFVCVDVNSNRYLVFLTNLEINKNEYLVVPISIGKLKQLINGKITFNKICMTAETMYYVFAGKGVRNDIVTEVVYGDFTDNNGLTESQKCLNKKHIPNVDEILNKLERCELYMEQQKKLAVVRGIAERVNERGGSTYYVGGYVRDKLLGVESKDIDVEIHGIEPSVLEDVLEEFGEVLKLGASFGVYNIRGYDMDIALPRTERKIGDKHTDFDVTTEPNMGLQEAARRRDFTMNAIMENVLTGEIVDYFGGCADLKAGVIRHINDITFKEDVLRVIRAAQFAARFDGTIAEGTLLICSGQDLSTLSKERVFGELEKALLKAKRPSVFFEQLRAMGQLNIWFSELQALIGAEQNVQYHSEGDVWNHTMLVLDAAASCKGAVLNPLGFMLAALCHDMGKPVSRSVDEKGIVHTYGHETAGVPIAERFLRRLTSDKKLIAYVLNMVELHMEPNIKADNKSRVKSTNKMFDRSIEPFDLILLAECDSAGKYPISDNNTVFLQDRLNTYLDIMQRPYVMGRDLVAMGFEPCAAFKDVLEYAHKLRLACVSKEDAVKQVCWFAKKRGCVKRNDVE